MSRDLDRLVYDLRRSGIVYRDIIAHPDVVRLNPSLSEWEALQAYKRHENAPKLKVDGLIWTRGPGKYEFRLSPEQTRALQALHTAWVAAHTNSI